MWGHFRVHSSQGAGYKEPVAFSKASKRSAVECLEGAHGAIPPVSPSCGEQLRSGPGRGTLPWSWHRLVTTAPVMPQCHGALWTPPECTFPSLSRCSASYTFSCFQCIIDFLAGCSIHQPSTESSLVSVLMPPLLSVCPFTSGVSSLKHHL